VLPSELSLEATPVEPPLIDPTMSPEEMLEFNNFILAIVSSFTNRETMPTNNSSGPLDLLKVLRFLGLEVPEGTTPSYKECNLLMVPQINRILQKTKSVLKSEDTRHAGYVKHGNLKIFSDLHGDLHSFLIIFANLILYDRESKTFSLGDDTWIFLGDFVDRGFSGLFILSIVFALKCMFPSQIVLIGGNHENRDLAERYGFCEEMEFRGMTEEYEYIIEDIFPMLRLFWVMGDTMFVHGGITSENMHHEMVRIDSDGNRIVSVLFHNNELTNHEELENGGALEEAEENGEYIPSIWMESKETQQQKNFQTRHQLKWNDPGDGDYWRSPDRFGFSRNSTRDAKFYNGLAIHLFLETPISSADGVCSLKVNHIARGHSHGSEYLGYEYNSGHGGGNNLFGGLVLILWSVCWYGCESREFGFGTKSPLRVTEEFSSGVDIVPRLSIGDYNYYAVTTTLDFDMLSAQINQTAPMLDGTLSNIVQLCKLTEAGRRLHPTNAPDDITPFTSQCSSRTNSNS